MTHSNEATPEVAPDAALYEAPRIESVLAPEELEREVLYAGTPVSNVVAT